MENYEVSTDTDEDLDAAAEYIRQQRHAREVQPLLNAYRSKEAMHDRLVEGKDFAGAGQLLEEMGTLKNQLWAKFKVQV
jgi:predicted transcriptional regulator